MGMWGLLVPIDCLPRCPLVQGTREPSPLGAVCSRSNFSGRGLWHHTGNFIRNAARLSCMINERGEDWDWFLHIAECPLNILGSAG